jgi:hypothetical protein
MARQQKRAEDRAQTKAANKKAPKILKPKAEDEFGQAKRYNADDLDDRKVRGALLFEASKIDPERVAILTDETTVYWSTKLKDRAYRTKRSIRNIRGTLQSEYRCTCPDFVKDGRGGCEHIFAERLRRQEVVVVGQVSAKRQRAAKAERRPARNRRTATGKPIRSTQRKARISMPAETPRLITSLRHEYDRRHPRPQERKRGGQLTMDTTRAVTLLHKIARRKSAEEMIYYFSQLIADGHLRLERPPHPNTFSDWMNADELTTVLHEMLKITSRPFRRREVAAIIDSTKMSQMSTAHGRGVDYLADDRPDAEWMRAHVLTGVETNIVMAVEFAGTRGRGTADINFVYPLIERALEVFNLQVLLADKGYHSFEHIRQLWTTYGIRAFVPVKKNIVRRERTEIWDPVTELIIMFDDHQREFHEIYRLRPKIEGFFSCLKRIAGEHCWSHGRPRKLPDGQIIPVDNSLSPCTAWKNETLCKLIYMNLRTTISLQEETGYVVDYLGDRIFFPEPAVPLIAA